MSIGVDEVGPVDADRRRVDVDPAMELDDVRLQGIRAEADRLGTEAHFRAASHERVGEIQRQRANLLGLPSVILGAVLSGTAGLSALLDGAPAVTAILAFAAAALGAARSFLRPDELADLHARKGASYRALDNEARRFLDIDALPDASIESLRSRLEAMAKRLDALREQNPMLPEPTTNGSRGG